MFGRKLGNAIGYYFLHLSRFIFRNGANLVADGDLFLRTLLKASLILRNLEWLSHTIAPTGLDKEEPRKREKMLVSVERTELHEF